MVSGSVHARSYLHGDACLMAFDYICVGVKSFDVGWKSL
jgi:hypothetical protein